jgi:hypothetical protein
VRPAATVISILVNAALLPHLREHDSPPILRTHMEIFHFMDALQMGSQTVVTCVWREGPVDFFRGVCIGRVTFSENQL